MPKPNRIIAARVPLVDGSGLVGRDWYRFFHDVWALVMQGGNTVSIADLTVAPPAGPTLEQYMVLCKAVQALQVAPATSGLLEQIAVLLKLTSGLPVVDYQVGVATGGGGSLAVTFAKTFTVAPAVVCTANANGSQYTINTNAPTTAGFTATSWLAGATTGGIGFSWVAVGS